MTNDEWKKVEKVELANLYLKKDNLPKENKKDNNKRNNNSFDTLFDNKLNDPKNLDNFIVLPRSKDNATIKKK